jgi:hypothetical protein
MKTVNEDPVEFFKNGGWNFLGQDSDVCICTFEYYVRIRILMNIAG